MRTHRANSRTPHRLAPSALFGLAAVALSLGGSARATEIALSKWIDKVKVSGDIRLRQEKFDKKTKGQTDRSRQRFRLRLGAELPFPSNVTAKLRFASGTGEQVSTNQSLDNLSSQKEFWIDRAYLEYKPWEFLKLNGGRMANPFWTVYTSDVVWDDDYNPEGFAQGFKFSLFGRGRIFLNGLQMVLDEDSGTNADQWMLGKQIGIEVPLFDESRFKVAGALYDWLYETTTTQKRAGTFNQATTNEGNRRYASGVLMNEFRVAELTGEYLTRLFGRPLAIQGTYVRNIDPVDTISPAETTGYQAGAKLGEAKGKKTAEIAYYYKSVDTDATVADIADSDFGDGGTNRRGHVLWIAYNPDEWIQLKAKYFVTQVVETKLSPGADDINRLQLDLSVKF